MKKCFVESSRFYNKKRTKPYSTVRGSGRRIPEEYIAKSVTAPKVWSLSGKNNRTALVAFIQGIVQKANDDVYLTVDMRQSKLIYADAAIYVKAVLARARVKFPKMLTRGLPPESDRCHQVITQTGISTLAGARRSSSVNREDVVHWNCIQGKEAEIKRFAEQLMPSHRAGLVSDNEAILSQAVREAIANAVEHAYDAPRYSLDSGDKWHIFAQSYAGYLTVVICDLGEGLTKTVARSERVEMRGVVRWIRQGAERNDKDILMAVLKATAQKRKSTSNASRTGKPYRNRGLPQILHVLRAIPGSDITIMSGDGGWRKMTDGGDDGVASQFKQKIEGTLIMWRLPITTGEANEKS